MSWKALTTATTAVVFTVAAPPALAAASGDGPGSAPVQLTYATRDDGRLHIHSAAATTGTTQRRLHDLNGRADVVAADVAHTVSATAADPLLAQQRSWRSMNVPATWSYPDAKGLVVAVVDSGVDGTHPDLRGRVLPGAQFLDPTVESSTGNGWNDRFGHGTAVAGIIGAGVDNGVGMAGIARGARILPVRVLDSTGQGSDVNVARGIVWAVDHGARVVNLSLGDSHPSDVEEAALQYANAHDVTVVASAGNSATSGNPVMYPAAYPGVIAVGADDGSGHAASFSEHGAFVDLSAPGVGVVVTEPNSGYGIGDGTSFAAPAVTAAAALLRGNLPALSAEAARRLLESTARDLGTPGVDPYFGHGSVNPAAAMARAGLRATPVASLSSPATVTVGSPLTLRAAVRAATGTVVSLQRVVGSTWQTVGRTVPDWKGDATFTTAAPASGRAVTYRLVAATAVTTRTVTLIPVPARTVTLALSGSRATGFVRAAITLGGGRTVGAVPTSLQYQFPGSTAWHTAGTWRTGSTGTLVVQFRPTGGGSWRFRAGADAVASPVRSVRW